MVGEDPDGPLVQMDIREFIMAIGARSASPGGGTVAALTSTLVSEILYVSTKYTHIRLLCRRSLRDC